MSKNLPIKEVKNLYKASQNAAFYLDRFKRNKLRLRGSFFLMIHKDLLAHKPKDAGKYRTKLHKLEIAKKTFSPTKAWKIESEIIDLIDFINNKHKWGPKYRKHFIKNVKNYKNLKVIDKRIFYKIFIAWYIHHKFIIIHPFVDGNGRMARLLMCLVLRYEGLSEISFPVLINFIISKNKNKYLDSLNLADKGKYIEGVLYMHKILIDSYNKTKKEGDKKTIEI